MSGVEYFRSQGGSAEVFSLFKRENPDNPDWCSVSRFLADWGDVLLQALEANPSRAAVEFAKYKLHEKYIEAYYAAPLEHRLDTSQADHPCLHQADLHYRQKFEKTEILAGIPELSQVQPVLEHP